MKKNRNLSYSDVGVLSNEELGLKSLLKWVNPTSSFRTGGLAGESVLEVGYFANVIRITNQLGLALTTDGVGTKILIAEMLNRYDTIGIDCVAMNVNDIICVGAEPVSMLDYIGIEKATPSVLDAVGKGLYEGARQAEINIVGGEISQMPDVIRGQKSGQGLDLVGMCVGIVPLDRVNTGQDVAPGDVILGLRSTGVHSNGFTLAREALFERGKLKPDSYIPELGKSVGEELLTPTKIYVAALKDLWRNNVALKAMINVTSEGFLNLVRVKPALSFRINKLPEPQPIFRLIQDLGNVSDAEMYFVFNMGIGFCLIVPPDHGTIVSIQSMLARHDIEVYEIGEVLDDRERRVFIPNRKLVGQNGRFREE